MTPYTDQNCNGGKAVHGDMFHGKMQKQEGIEVVASLWQVLQTWQSASGTATGENS